MSRISAVSDSTIIEAAKSCSNMSEAARCVGLSMSAFRPRAIKLGVYVPNQMDPTNRVDPPIGATKYLLCEILSGKHPAYSTNDLRKRLIGEGLKNNECEECKCCGEEVSLCLDHIDGDCTNHVLTNLQILCPNCHSKTSTFAGRNKRRIKAPTPDIVIVDLIIKGLDNTSILNTLDMYSNGANCKRVNKIREMVQHIIGRVTESGIRASFKN